MNELNLGPSQLVFILILTTLWIIIQQMISLIRFIKKLKNEQELNAIITNGVDKGTSIIGVLGLEAIIFIIPLYIYKWNFLNTIKSPVMVLFLVFPLLNSFTQLGFYYIKVRYLNRTLHNNQYKKL